MTPKPITNADTSWWTTSRRRVFYDAHTPDFNDPHQQGNIGPAPIQVLAAADPQRDIALMAEAGTDSVVLFAKCQYGNSYHPTRVGRQHSALEGRDLFGEQLAAAHSQGIRVIAYFSNMWDVTAAGSHPEWVLQPSPFRPSTGRWPALCLLSDYRHYALQQVQEIARNYPIDGLWSDILTAGPCVCHRCSAAFEAKYGRPMPKARTDENWHELVQFANTTTLEYLREQRAILKQERPQAALIPNYYATSFVDPVTGLGREHLALADIGSSEGYTDWHGLGFPSYASAYIQGGVFGGPSEVLVSRFVHTWDFTLRSEAQLRFEAFTVAAHGCTVSIDDQPYPTGSIEPEVYKRIKPAFERIAQRQPWLDGTPVPYVGLYVSERSRQLESMLGGPENPSLGEQSAQFPPSQTRSSRSDFDAAIAGTYRALVEGHIPVQIVDERPQSLNDLSRFPVLVLPDVLSLSDTEISAITNYVRGGGGLVVTGECGVIDETGRASTSEELRELLGVDYGQPGRYPFPFVSLAGEIKDQLGDWPISHYGPIRPLLRLAPDIAVLATRTDPVLETDDVTFWHNNQPGPGESTEDPVIVERSVGRGRVIVSAARLGNNHARLGHAAYRTLIVALVRRAGLENDLPVTLEGTNPNTELIVTKQGDDLVVHLVTGYAVSRLDVAGAVQPGSIETVAQLASLVLRVPEEIAAAWRVVDDQLVPVEIIGDRIGIRDVDDWETIVLQSRATSGRV